jgi:hypothetical protein
MVRFIEATMQGGKKVHLNVDRISAIQELSQHATKSAVFTSGDDGPFQVMEDPATLLRKIEADV